jgi:ABC-type transporter Mla subunit MlaD
VASSKPSKPWWKFWQREQPAAATPPARSKEPLTTPHKKPIQTVFTSVDKPTAKILQEIEAPRRAIEKINNELMNLSSYLDYGRPSPQQAAKAEAETAQLNGEVDKLKAQFNQIISTYRTEQPEAVQRWFELHQQVCQDILADPELPKAVGPGAGLETSLRTRYYVANETLQAWQKAQTGADVYVFINTVWMPDYQERVEQKLGA